MIEDVLHDLPPLPAANPEFRAALKAAFLEGQLEGAASSVGAGREEVSSLRPVRRSTGPRADARRRAEGSDSSSFSSGPFSSGPFSWQVAVGVVAIAAAILLLILFPNEGAPVQRERWAVATTGNELRVDQVKFRAGEERLVEAINGAHSLASLDSKVQLWVEGRVRLGMEPSSLLDLSAVALPAVEPGPVPSDELFFRLDSGALHLMTSRSNPDQAIIVETPHAKVRIVGSVLSIEVFDNKGTCICVKYGEATVEILSGTGDGVAVGGDTTCFVFADGAEPAVGPSTEMVSAAHLAPLLAFYDAEF